MNVAVVSTDSEERPWQLEPAKLNRSDFDQLLRWAFERGSSDIMIASDEAIGVKIDGEIVRVTNRRVSKAEMAELLNDAYRPGASAQLAGGEPLDFSYSIKIDRGVFYRYRVSATSTGSGEGIEIVLRTIPGHPPTVEELGIPKAVVEMQSDLKVGLFLVVGATGSGKSTSLAALISHRLFSRAEHILSYESPIEYNLRVANQRGLVAQAEIPRDVPNYARGIANALRRAPDVILVQEARGAETIGAVVRASQTGHAVYSTVHTNGVAATIPRMMDEFPAGEQTAAAAKLIDAMRGIVHQRLVPGRDGGRVALFEYLEFTADIRDRLLDNIAEIQTLLPEMIEREGRSLLMDAREAFVNKRISERTYKIVKRELQRGAA